MTASELALLMAAVLCAVGFAALIVTLMRVHDTMDALRREVEALRRETGPLLEELQDSVDEAQESVRQARDDLERFDQVLGSAEAISGAVQGGGRLARTAFSAPVIKTVALASGSAQGARRFRRRGAPR